MSINKVFLSGNLTREPEVRLTQTGTPVLSIGIAVNDRRKNNHTGQWEDYANFINCVMFGSRAENLAQYLEKGNKVTIEGKLRWSQWEQDGKKRSKIEVIIDDIELMSRRPNTDSIPASVGVPTTQNVGDVDTYQNDEYAASVYAQDIPF